METLIHSAFFTVVIGSLLIILSDIDLYFFGIKKNKPVDVLNEKQYEDKITTIRYKKDVFTF